MQRYKDYAPTAFDSKGSFLLDQGDWIVVPVGQNRDSECLDQSNFATALALLGGESETVEVHRFGHWACGWVEIIIVDNTVPSNVIAVQGITDRLYNYPVLDDDDYSEREGAKIHEVWDNMSIGDKVDTCRRNGVSIFQARQDSPYGTDIEGVREAILGH